MNKRSREILSQLLAKNEYGQNMTLDHLAEMFQVSTRTIRYDINQINDFLEENGLRPLLLKKHGVIYTQKDIQKVKELLRKEEFYAFKLTREERIFFSAVLLICEENYLTLLEIADYMFVSRSTVIQDLEYLKEFFKEHDLYLMSYSNKGLLLEGREITKRRLLLDMIQEGSSIFTEQPIFQHLISCIYNEDDINLRENTIEKIINEAEHIYGRFLTDAAFHFLKTYLKISITRLRKGHFVDVKKEENEKYKMAEGILNQIQRYIVKEIPNSEIYFLSELLNQLKYIKKTTSNQEIVKMQVIARDFIENISNEIGRNLQGDYLFFENLVNHLESTFATVGDYHKISSVVEEVLERYPKVLNAATKNVYIFEEYIGRKLSNPEIAYIVVHICAAIERNKNENAKYSVIIVCHGGIGTSQLLLAKLEKFFHLNVLDVVPAHDIAHVNLDEIDVVISTIALPNKNIEYIQVDPLLTDEDCIKVGEKLSKIKPKNHSDHIESKDFHDAMESLEMIQEIVEQDLENEEKVDQIRKILEEFFYKKEEKMLSDLLIADAIQLNVECDDWKSAIRASAKYLLEVDAITENYVDEMIHNVIENGPYIVVAPGFALPHEAINAGAKKVGMSLIRLKKPVFFGREEMDPVEWICCLSAIDNEIHLKAMFQLVNLFYNEEFRKKIKSSKTSEEVFNMIKRFEYEMR